MRSAVDTLLGAPLPLGGGSSSERGARSVAAHAPPDAPTPASASTSASAPASPLSTQTPAAVVASAAATTSPATAASAVASASVGLDLAAWLSAHGAGGMEDAFQHEGFKLGCNLIWEGGGWGLAV